MSATGRKEGAAGGRVADEEEARSPVELDCIMCELGEFGRFQARLMLLSAVVSIFAAWTFSEYLFTTARINTRCLIPECDGPEPALSPGWLAGAVPGSPDHLDSCHRFAANSSLKVDAGDVCPAALFDHSTVETCQEYVYEINNTIVYDFGLACDEWRRTLVGSLRTVGNLLALPITGYVSDRWGRRPAVALTTLASASLGLLRYWADTYPLFVLSGVVEATFGSGAYTCFYILLIESMGKKYRTISAACYISFWATGMMLLGLIAWAVPHWRALTLTLYIPQFISIIYFCIITESARWYLSKGRYTKSHKALQKIAETNGRTLSARSNAVLRRLAEEEKIKLQQRHKFSKEPWLVVAVFKHKKVLLRCVVSPVWWVTTTFIYYGLSINAVNMVGNSYLNFVAVSAVEIPGFWTAVLLLDRLGRKPVLIAAFWVCAACQIAYIFIPKDYVTLLLIVYLLGKYSIAVVFKSLYIYTAELYPTEHRNTLFAFTSMVGRIGSIIAPLTPAFGAVLFESFPFVLFGSFALVSGLLMFLTPETLGTKLPDTMEEADNLKSHEEHHTFIPQHTTVSKSIDSMEMI